KRQQIANRVGVFRPVEAMERGTSGVGLGVDQAIAFTLDCTDESLISGLIGSRRAGRRHLASAQLAQHLFPNGAVAVETGEIQGLKVHPCAGLGTKVTSVTI